jgi:MYXO-CTERM domain-containing protein
MMKTHAMVRLGASFALGAICLGLAAGPAPAANITADATLTWQADGPNFDYTITLNNSAASDASIGTFWYAWVPGKDFLATSPISTTSPTGWTALLTHVPNVPTNGVAIQWTTGAADSPNNVAIGGSKVFKFTSADTPAEIAGESVFYPGTPVGLSFVYPGAPFSDAGHSFVVQSVPEPSSAVLGALGLVSALGLAAGRRRA